MNKIPLDNQPEESDVWVEGGSSQLLMSTQTVQAENPKKIRSTEENSGIMCESSQDSNFLKSVYVADDIYLIDEFKPTYNVEVKGCIYKKEMFKMENLIAIGHWEFHLQTTNQSSVTQVERRYSDFEKLRQAFECRFPG
jgi:hypothetical protein